MQTYRTLPGGRFSLFMVLAGMSLLASCDEISDLFAGEEQVVTAEGYREQATAPEAAGGTATQAQESERAKKDDGTIRMRKPQPMTGVYKYVDDQGVVNYVDDINKVPRKYRRRAHHPVGGSYTIYHASPVDDLIEKYQVDADKYRDNKASGKRAAARGGQVVLYTTSWCPYCKQARRYLQKRGVKFIEKDVGRSRAALEEMLRKSGGARGVPVIDVGGTVIRGFNVRALDQALDK